MTAGGYTALVWNVATVARRTAEALPAVIDKNLATWWDQLGDADPKGVTGALAGLAQGGEEVAALLHRRPAEPAADLQADRALEALELAGDRLARKALKALAADAPDGRVKSAAAAVERRTE